MLLALSIRDFAIIDRVDLELASGLTVITGETGAGKSILINALNLVLGGRGSAEVIRTGAEAAQVEAVFDLTAAPEARARLVAAGIEAGDQLLVRRVLARSGRHRVYLDDTLVTLGTLAQAMAGLVDISGQHEHYSLLRTEAHLEVLDRVAALGALRAEVGEAHGRVAELDARLAELQAAQRGRAEREDFLRFQLGELTSAGLGEADEEEQLEQERGVLRNAEKLQRAAAEAEGELYEDQDAAAERLSRAARRIRELAGIDATLEPVASDLETAQTLVEEAARTLAAYARRVRADPERLELIESRLALFARLRRKYGTTLAEVIARRDGLQAELAALGSVEETLGDLERERTEAASRLRHAAGRLTDARHAGSERFTGAVGAELHDLGMAGATLQVRLEPATSGVDVGGRLVGPRGADRVELLLSANPGEEPQPLARIASGGELSRFMLAVKRVIAARDPVGTYVFDEVDTGVGGPTAEAIGRKLKSVSATRQALCITHLPQIAAFADHHLQVVKRIDGERTRSEVQHLTGDARVEELARMLGGSRITQTTRAHAEELLRHGAEAG